MSMSSGCSSSSAEMVFGSRAIPQIGQLPGASRTISGCMGQTHSIFDYPETIGSTGSRAMPHFGQAPGLGSLISGCMGQVYISTLRTRSRIGCDTTCRCIPGSSGSHRRCLLHVWMFDGHSSFKNEFTAVFCRHTPRGVPRGPGQGLHEMGTPCQMPDG